MKKTLVKRLVYRHVGTNEISYGNEEYDAHLTSANILGAIFEAGKHEWTPNFDHASMYQYNNKGELAYVISVGIFYQYQKTKLDLFFDNIKRILGV